MVDCVKTKSEGGNKEEEKMYTYIYIIRLTKVLHVLNGLN